MTKVLSVINMKGGVGKTTIAVNLAYTLAKEFSKKVLLVDADPQMNASQYTLNPDQVREISENPKKTIYGIFKGFDSPSILSEQKGKKAVETTLYNAHGFDVLPSHLQVMTLNLSDQGLKLKKYLDEKCQETEYDLVIIDCPPTISPYTRMALLASTDYLVPMKIDFLSLFGLPLLQAYIRELTDEYGYPINFLGIVLTMTRSDYAIYASVKTKIESDDEWKMKLFRAELKQKVIIANALSPDRMAQNLPFIIELNDTEARNQMMGIAREVTRKLRL